MRFYYEGREAKKILFFETNNASSLSEGPPRLLLRYFSFQKPESPHPPLLAFKLSREKKLPLNFLRDQEGGGFLRKVVSNSPF